MILKDFPSNNHVISYEKNAARHESSKDVQSEQGKISMNILWYVLCNMNVSQLNIQDYETVNNFYQRM